jgi:uncharacterized protein (TIGR03086 family)
MHTILDVREADAAAVAASVAVVRQLTAADLGRPTPCTDWDLGALLAHMTVQHRGFAAAAAGHGADLGEWQPGPLGDDPVQAYADAAEKVITAFAADGVLERAFALPEVRSGQSFPGRIAIGFHLVDYVVHGWDVATSLGIPFDLPADVLEVTLPIAEAVPGGPARTVPGAAFAPAQPITGEAAALDKILALLGRSPGDGRSPKDVGGSR